MKQLRNMPRKKVSIPVVESKPKVKYVSPIKDYSVSYDAVIKIRQTSLQPIIPAKLRLGLIKETSLENFLKKFLINYLRLYRKLLNRRALSAQK